MILLSPKILGLALVVMAVFTVLSLISEERGKVTGAWIDYLEHMVGLGAWGVPLVVGAIGIWLIIRSVEEMPDVPWQRPAGILLLFVAYLTGTAMLSGVAAEASSGVVGSQTAATLERLLGGTGAWIAVSVFGIAGLILLTDRLLLDAGYEIVWSVEDWWHGRGAKQNTDKANAVLEPELPIPSGQLPWWKRMREKWRTHDNDAASKKTGPADAVFIEPEPTTSNAPVSSNGQPPVKQSSALPRAPEPAQRKSASTQTKTEPKPVKWQLPAIDDMLANWDRQVESDDLIRDQGRLIQETLSLFGVPTDFEGAYKGPSVTQYLIKPGYVERIVRGEDRRVKVKVSKIAGLGNDLALALAAPSVRIEAPVPGTNYVGIEVPNQESNIVGLKELMESEPYQNLKGALPVALGEDVKGQAIVTDLARMPHLLIAGSTGSGKSVCINSIINCLLLTHTPDSLRLLLIDPKMVELNVYNGIPHLLNPVVTEIDRASGVLFWAVKEMERRYQCMSDAKARDIVRYNTYLQKRNEKPLPYIVIVVDEMADLMLASPEEVEKHICRLAQMARAVGIHLIIATQRPSVDVITGLIKANFPARIAFAVSSQVDSRVILDTQGAERLLGRGDMLFMAPDTSKLERLQGTFLSDEEISNVVEYWKSAHHEERPTPMPIDATEPDDKQEAFGAYAEQAESQHTHSTPNAAGANGNDTDAASKTVSSDLEGMPDPAAVQSATQPELFHEIERMKEVDSRDDLYDDAVRIVTEEGRGSVSMLQNKLRIGYGRSSRLVEQLEHNGVLGPDLGGNRGRALRLGTLSDGEDQGEGDHESDVAPWEAEPPSYAESDATETPVSATEWEDLDDEFSELYDEERPQVPRPSDAKAPQAEPVPPAATDVNESASKENRTTEQSSSAASAPKQADHADSDSRTPRVWM